jgi:DNA-binding NarL/FixJ family response regulator
MSEKRAIKLLLVEDNPSDAAQLKRVLAQSRMVSFGVTHTEFLNSALLAVTNPRDGQFDVIFLDMNLQDSRGIDTVTAMHRAAPEVPIVVLSGQEDIKIADLTLRCGATDFVVKRDIGEYDEKLIAEELERKAWFALRRQEQFMTTQALTRISMEKGGARPADPALVQTLRQRITAIEEGITDFRVYLQLHYPEAWDALSTIYQNRMMVPLRDIKVHLKLEDSDRRTVLHPQTPEQRDAAISELTTSPMTVSRSLEEAEAALLRALKIEVKDIQGHE